MPRWPQGVTLLDAAQAVGGGPRLRELLVNKGRKLLHGVFRSEHLARARLLAPLLEPVLQPLRPHEARQLG